MSGLAVAVTALPACDPGELIGTAASPDFVPYDPKALDISGLLSPHLADPANTSPDAQTARRLALQIAGRRSQTAYDLAALVQAAVRQPHKLPAGCTVPDPEFTHDTEGRLVSTFFGVVNTNATPGYSWVTSFAVGRDAANVSRLNNVGVTVQRGAVRYLSEVGGNQRVMLLPRTVDGKVQWGLSNSMGASSSPAPADWPTPQPATGQSGVDVAALQALNAWEEQELFPPMLANTPKISA